MKDRCSFVSYTRAYLAIFVHSTMGKPIKHATDGSVVLTFKVERRDRTIKRGIA